MNVHDGFDRTVADWLDQQAGHGMPGYLDEIVTPPAAKAGYRSPP